MAFAKFSLGQVFMTRGVDKLLKETGRTVEDLLPYLGRHATGDWGDVDDEDREENELSVREGFRILSAYRIDATKIWIITEADRSATTVLLPDEY